MHIIYSNIYFNIYIYVTLYLIPDIIFINIHYNYLPHIIRVQALAKAALCLILQQPAR